MKTILRILISSFLLVFISSQLLATHNRAGQITYEQIGELTIRITLTTWTKTSSLRADRDSLTINWGDGTDEVIFRVNGNGQVLANDVKQNIYIGEHTYPGRAEYTISMMDPNRVGGILNVNPPSSINVPFFIQTSFTFLNPQFQGFNSSPRLLQPPIDFACVGQEFRHNPNAYDVDGDSISYELISPLQEANTNVTRYSFPNQISPGANNAISLNRITGDFVWLSPQQAGEYNIAIAIREYRNGTLINTTIRDMQILVENCEDVPPVIETEMELCVVAGTKIEIPVIATDVDPGQLVKLTALGGPFELDFKAAQFIVSNNFEAPPVSGIFEWETSCEHISDQYYSVVFKAVDNLLDTTGLATLKTLRIKIVGPPPENLTAESDAGEIILQWDKPYFCENALDDYFQGFSIWRRNSSNIFEIDSCVEGLAGRGYEKIEFNTTEMDNGQYIYRDQSVEKGINYCYRILAEFARTSAGGQPFNRVESLPSEEVCMQLNRDIPYITNVDVEMTSETNGEIFVRWLKPVAAELDTTENPGPYKYVLQRADGINGINFMDVPGATFRTNLFSENVDTTFSDININTFSQSYTYRVAFFVNGNETDVYGFSAVASSIFLSIAPADRALVLSWDEFVPWQNLHYDIFKKNTSGDFDSIGRSFTPKFVDINLENGNEYCYRIRSYGVYNLDNMTIELYNKSQEACGIPMDITPPCAPVLNLDNVCDDATEFTPEDIFINTLNWTKPHFICDFSADVTQYNVYYAADENSDFELIATIDDREENEYQHRPEFGIAGCYRVSAIDSTGNESDFSNIECVENCPLYQLPNVFTPNGDGTNDLYQPFPYRFIDRVEMIIFNRWGQKVFETTNPDLDWDGFNLADKELSEGTYYYTCKVFESSVAEDIGEAQLLSGYIQLLR